ncbi:hypothetical protein PROPEN_04380 [Proteus penneri ATCC 35198]|nr:hypothetical protein PROPEN_04380 [Proteus penneri ATCC 35198]
MCFYALNFITMFKNVKYKNNELFQKIKILIDVGLIFNIKPMTA